MKVWRHIADCLKDTGTCALVTIGEAHGSSPRESGARMVVRPDGSFHGTIGGGTLEFEAIRIAAEFAGKNVAGLKQKTVSLGPDLGQCCGGRVTLTIEVLTSGQLDMAVELAGLEEDRAVFATEADVRFGKVGLRRIASFCDTPVFSFTADPEGNSGKLREVFGTLRRPLYLFGAGHVGKALVLALAQLPFEITWVDSRKEQFPGAVPANVTCLLSGNPAGILSQAPDGAFVIAMTHSHALDEEIMARSLMMQRFGYCGVIGSRTKRVRFRKRLTARGLPEAVVAKMVCPIGLGEISSKHPAAIAAGIAADLLVRDEMAQAEQSNSGDKLARAGR